MSCFTQQYRWFGPKIIQNQYKKTCPNYLSMQLGILGKWGKLENRKRVYYYTLRVARSIKFGLQKYYVKNAFV